MSRPDKIDPTVLPLNKNCGKFRISTKDAIIYALGIGFNMDPFNTKDFKYTFEMHKDFTIFPTQAAVFAQQEQMKQLTTNTKFPSFPRQSIIHGEEYFHMIHDRIKLDTDYHVEAELIDMVDKGPGKGVLFVHRISGYLINQKGERDLAYFTDRAAVLPTMGGSGCKPTGRYQPFQKPPKRQHDLIINEKTFPSQAFFYRVNSAPNPVHIDPQLARSVGLPNPSLHGIATFAIMVRTIVQNFLNYDETQVRSAKMRLTGFVFPGQTFEIKIWKETNKIFFEAEVVERKAKAAIGVIGLRENAKL